MLELPVEGRRLMALVYWMWLAHPLTHDDAMMFQFGEFVGVYMLGGWVRAWANGQT
jgi:hypothetical protein